MAKLVAHQGERTVIPKVNGESFQTSSLLAAFTLKLYFQGDKFVYVALRELPT